MNWDKYKYFKPEEFYSSDVKDEKMTEEFMDMLSDARERAGIAFRISSGYRTPERNKAVGGVESSSHLKGCAADIHVTGSRQRFKITKALFDVGFTRVGEGSDFIHVDNDSSKSQEVKWRYDK